MKARFLSWVTRRIVWAWVLTTPASASMAALAFFTHPCLPPRHGIEVFSPGAKAYRMPTHKGRIGTGDRYRQESRCRAFCKP